MEIERIDHIVLTVSDVEETVRFYSEILGMREVVFAESRRALAFGGQKINLHQAGREFEPKAARSAPGSADFCLIAQAPLSEVMDRLAAGGVEILQGPVEKTGRSARCSRSTSGIPTGTSSRSPATRTVPDSKYVFSSPPFTFSRGL